MSAPVPTDATSAILPTATPNITSYFNRGPLTTTFPPPTTCLQTLSRVVMYVGSSATTNTYYGHWFEGDSACYPTGTMPATLLNSPTYWGTYWCKFSFKESGGMFHRS